MKKGLLIVEPGIRLYKEPIVKSIRESYDGELYFAAGLHQNMDESWVSPYASGWIPFSYPKDDLVERVRKVQLEHGIVFEGVLTYVETSVHFVNRLQHALGLPVVCRQPTKIMRSKREMRELLKREGFTAQPAFHVIQSETDITTLLNTSPKFPLILKPAEMMASLGVCKVASAEEIRRVYPKVAQADFWDEDLREKYGDISTEVLCEELIEGPEYSIESYVFRGETHVLGITRKDSPANTFDELSHTFPAPDLTPDIKKKMEQLVRESHRILQLQNTLTHTEVKVQNGEPYLIEINCRLAGELISELVQRSYGENVGKLLIDVHTDRTPTFSVPASAVPHFIYYISTTLEGRVVGVPTLEKLPPPFLEFKHHVSVGDLLYRDGLNSVSRLGHAISTYTPGVTAPFNESDYRIQSPFGVAEVFDDKIIAFIASIDDAEALFRIEHSSWNPKQAAPIDLIENRIRMNPSCTVLGFSLKLQRPVGFVTLLPVEDFEVGAIHPWEYYAERAIDPNYFARLKNPNCYYALTLTSEELAPRGTGSALVKLVDNFCRIQNYSLAYGIRVPHFAEYANQGVSIENYYRGLITGKYHEDIFKVSENAGGTPAGVLANFYDDPESLDYAIAIVHPHNPCHQIKK